MMNGCWVPKYTYTIREPFWMNEYTSNSNKNFFHKWYLFWWRLMAKPCRTKTNLYSSEESVCDWLLSSLCYYLRAFLKEWIQIQFEWKQIPYREISFGDDKMAKPCRTKTNSIPQTWPYNYATRNLYAIGYWALWKIREPFWRIEYKSKFELKTLP